MARVERVLSLMQFSDATARTRGPYDFQGSLGYNLALTLRYAF